MSAVWIACGPPPAIHETSFSLPHGGHRDFLDLPWPCDVDRRDDGTLDLRAFPNPTGSSTLEDYLALAETVVGYSTNGVVYLGIGVALDPATLPADSWASLENDSAIQFVDVDADSPDRGQRLPLWFKQYQADLFVPDGGLAVLPVVGFTLLPSTTYAVVVTRRAHASDGQELAAPADLQAVLAAEVPGDAALARAHALFAPLRDQWESEGRDLTEIALATVFTTQDPMRRLLKGGDAVRARNSAVIERIEEPADYRAYDNFYVFEGELTLDQFQQGEPPFSTAGSGDVALDEDGVPIAVRRETMPFALTVPRGQVPDRGWPLALVAHGTGGYWRGFIGNRTGDEANFLAQAGYAALGISQPLHRDRAGYRAGQEELAAFNFINPIAGRGSWIQSALETVMLARYFRDGRLPLGSNHRRIPIDHSRIAFFGHSQGGLSGTLALAVDRDIDAAVLSGAGGGLALSLVEKTEPQVPVEAIRTMLSLPEDHVIDVFHPVLTLVQTFAEEADTLNYAPLLYRRGSDRMPPTLLMTSGFYDSYVPVATQAPLAAAFGLPLIEPIVEDAEVLQLSGLPILPEPASNTIVSRGREVTAGLVQFKAAPFRDGHFVVFELGAATYTVREFFKSTLGPIPVIDTRP
ncbi:MAG: hypothetical protein JXR83_16965 [Deltaproteobacteria bacterium]|nr:hypothetical protein [Deltaproteobacteria bacterium]